MNFQMFKVYLEKAEDPEKKLTTSTQSSKNWDLWKKWDHRKNIYVYFVDYPKVFDFVDHHKLENS